MASTARATARAYIAFHRAVTRTFAQQGLPSPSQPRPSRPHQGCRSLSSSQKRPYLEASSSSGYDQYGGQPPFGLEDLVSQSVNWSARQGDAAATASFPQHEGMLPFLPPPPPPLMPMPPIDSGHTTMSTHPDVEAVPEPRQEAPFSPSMTALSRARAHLRRGQVLRGMHYFTQAVSKISIAKTLLPSTDGKRGSVRPDQILEVSAFAGAIYDLRNTLFGRTATIEGQGLDDKKRIWRPKDMPKDIPLQLVSKEAICTAALATVFDGCLRVGYRPTQSMSAALLSCLSRTLTSKSFEESVKTVISAQQGEHLELELLTTIISSFGSKGRADRGQDLLRSWVAEGLEISGDDPLRHPGVPFALNGWSSDVAVWTCLIRSFATAGMMQEANEWLVQYGQVLSNPSIPPQHKPELSSAPYLSLMTSIIERPKDGMERFVAGPSQDSVRQIEEILSMMRQSQIKPDTQIINFLTQFKYRQADVDSASRLMATLAPPNHTVKLNKEARLRQSVGLHWDARTFAQAFVLLGKTGSIHTDVDDRETVIQQPRELLKILLHRQVADDKMNTNSFRQFTVLSSRTLLSALRTCLTFRDYPAAIIALQCLPLVGLERKDLSTAWVMINRGLAEHGIGSDETHDANRPSTLTEVKPDGQADVLNSLQALLEVGVLKEVQRRASGNKDAPEWTRLYEKSARESDQRRTTREPRLDRNAARQSDMLRVTRVLRVVRGEVMPQPLWARLSRRNSRGQQQQQQTLSMR